MGRAWARPACCAMITYPEKECYTAEDLVDIVRILRDPQDGCPWDKVQTHTSIRMNFLEEAYEAVDAIDLDDPRLMCEELGDVLMQVVFHARIEEERGHFAWPDVCDAVCRKLLGRHPNIFAGDAARQGINDWDVLKNMEKGRTTLQSELESVPRALPALMRAAKLQKRARRCGAAVPADGDALAEPLKRLQTSDPDSARAQAAAGQLLFAAVALVCAAGLDPEEALQVCNERFVREHTPDAPPRG